MQAALEKLAAAVASAGRAPSRAHATNDEVLSRHRSVYNAKRDAYAQGRISVFSFDNGAGLGRLGRGPARVRSAAGFGALDSLDRRTRIAVAEMELGSVHRGRFLRGKLVEQPLIMKGVYQVFADGQSGQLVRIAFYNCDDVGGGWQKSFAKGRELCVRDPYYKVAADGTQLVRVESPADVVFAAADAPLPGAAGQEPSGSTAPAQPAPASSSSKKKKKGKAKETAGAEAAEDESEGAVAAAVAAGLGAEELNQKGTEALKGGRHAEAEAWYSAAMRADPGTAKYPSNRAAVRLQMERYAEAYADALLASNLDPKWAKPVVRMASALFAQGNHEEALRQYERALKIDPAGESRAAAEEGVASCRKQIAEQSIRTPLSTGSSTAIDQAAKKAVMEKIKSGELVLEFDKLTLEEKNLCMQRMQCTAVLQEAGLVREGVQGRKQNAKRAAQLYRQAAEKGVAEGMYNLGKLLQEDGKFAEALRLWREAAEQPAWLMADVLPNTGVAEAMNALGCAYREGVGVDVDLAQAVSWFRRAADTGTREMGGICALNNLGHAFEAGKGVPRDHAEAARWYRVAADTGYAVAQCNLAQLYASGSGVPIDLGLAREWFEKAAAQNYPPALVGLSHLAASPATAFAARLAAAERMPEAMHGVGVAYLAGKEGAPQSTERGLAWLKRSAAEGHGEGMCDLGLLLIGKVPHIPPHFNLPPSELAKIEDAKKGADWLLRAAEKGVLRAGYVYAYALLTGRGVDKDVAMARKWMRLVAKRGLQLAVDEDAGARFERLCKLAEAGKLEEETKEPDVSEVSDPTVREFLQSMMKHAKKEDPQPGKGVRVPPRGSGGVRAYDMASLQLYGGSRTAQRLMDARRHFDAAVEGLMRNDFPAAFRALSACYQREGIVVQLPQEAILELLEGLDEYLADHPNDADALFASAMLSMTINARSPAETVRIVDRCIKLSPNVAGFHVSYACHSCFAKRYDKAVPAFERALELQAQAGDPYRYDTLYLRAAALFQWRAVEEPGRVVAAFEEFLREAPPDERKVAEALYQVCQLQITALGDVEAARATLERARAAERARLPVFPPIGDFFPKESCERLLGLPNVGAAVARDQAREGASSSRRCAACGAEASSECGRCHAAVYCGPACQRADWRRHKADCKKAAGPAPAAGGSSSSSHAM